MNLLTNITINVLITYVMSLFITMTMSLFLTITASLVAGDYITLYLVRRATARRAVRTNLLRLTK